MTSDWFRAPQTPISVLVIARGTRVGGFIWCVIIINLGIFCHVNSRANVRGGLVLATMIIHWWHGAAPSFINTMITNSSLRGVVMVLVVYRYATTSRDVEEVVWTMKYFVVDSVAVKVWVVNNIGRNANILISRNIQIVNHEEADTE